jgi:hypothetical protein
VLRVSIRQSDDLLGHLTAYFNVPGIFGSTPYQVRHHIGVDCADVLMAAHANWQGTTLTRDYNVAMLTEQFPVLLQTTVTAGEPAADIRWGRTVRAGDWLAVKYRGARSISTLERCTRTPTATGDWTPLIGCCTPAPIRCRFPRWRRVGLMARCWSCGHVEGEGNPH